MAFTSFAETKGSKEYQLKAAYLLNFARFVYWPEAAFTHTAEKFNICVYGENPFGDSLDRLSSKKIHNRKIHIIYTDNSEKIVACHIVYVGKSKKSTYAEELKEHKNSILLSVSDIGDFSLNGGMIEFIRVKKKIKFIINVNESMDAGIKYRSQLLEVAEKLR